MKKRDLKGQTKDILSRLPSSHDLDYKPVYIELEILSLVNS
jgi:hypothetical protein